MGLGIVGVFPSLVNFLPNQAFLNSDTAPPPKNRRLQICMEEYLYEWYQEGPEKRKEYGELGREYALREDVAFSSKHMLGSVYIISV